MRTPVATGLLAATLLLSGPAFAIDTGTSEANERSENSSVTFSGIGLTRASSDFNNLKPAINLNASIGFRIPTINIFAVELQISQTVIPGQNGGQQQCSSSGGGLLGGGGSSSCAPGRYTSSQDDLQMNAIGVFAVARSPGRFYGLAQIGYRYLNTNIPELSEDRSGNAYGAGAGYRYGKSLSGVEINYTRYSKDLNFLGFSIAYGFGGRD